VDSICCDIILVDETRDRLNTKLALCTEFFFLKINKYCHTGSIWCILESKLKRDAVDTHRMYESILNFYQKTEESR